MGDKIPKLLQLDGLQKSFVAPDARPQRIVNGPEFSVAAGAQLAPAGESGSGKTTLLNLIAGSLKPDAGTIRLNGERVSDFREPQRDHFRAQNTGYIFQTFNLLQGYTCQENVLLGLSFGYGADRVFAENLLQRVSLGGRLHHCPGQLSTGPQQRVAVTRVGRSTNQCHDSRPHPRRRWQVGQRGWLHDSAGIPRQKSHLIYSRDEPEYFLFRWQSADS